MYVVPLKTKEHAYQALEDLIHEVAAPSWIYSDNAGEETSLRWISILRKSCNSGPHTSEPHSPHQNHAKHQIQDVKCLLRLMIKCSGCPSKYWCHVVMLTVEILNHTAHQSIDHQVLYTLHYGDTADISVFRFHLWQEIEYLEPTISFPEDQMLPGRWLGIARSTGDEFTYHIVPEHKDKCCSMPIMHSVLWTCALI